MNVDLSALGSLAGSLARAGLPALSTLLGAVVPPPYDLLVKPAFSAVAWAMGVNADAPDAVQQVQAKVDADPAGAAQQLQPVEDAHHDAAAEIEAYLKDVQDARSTEVKLVESGSKLAYVPAIWTIIVALGFLGSLFVLIFHPFEFSNNQTIALNILFGVLTGEFARCGNFWLGTSQSAGKRTDQALTFAAKAPPAVQAPARRR